MKIANTLVMASFIMAPLLGLSMSCKSKLTTNAKRAVEFDHPHDAKSAVDSLGVGYLRDSSSPQVQAWIKSQNERTTSDLSKNTKGEADGFDKKILDRSVEIFPKNPPMQVEIADGSLMMKGGGLVFKDLKGTETVLIPKIVHPNNGGSTVVGDFKVSPDARYVAYAAVKNGLDVNQWSIFDLQNRQTVAGPFDVRMLDFNWSPDSKGIYYTKWANLDEAASGVMYAHNYYVDLKTKESQIVFVPPGANSIEIFGIETLTSTKGDNRLIAYRTQGVAEVPNALYIGSKGQADQAKGEFQVGNYKWRTLVIPETRSLGRLIGTSEGKLLIRTSDAGDKFGIVSLNPDTGKTSVIVPGVPDETLLVAQVIGDKMFLQYLDTKQAHNIIKVYSVKGKLLKSFKMSDIDPSIPNTGSLSSVMGHKSSDNIYFSYNDTAQPSMTVKLNTKTLVAEKLATDGVNFDVAKVRYDYKEAVSEDGMPVTYKVWSRTDQEKPKYIYLYYYGFIGLPQLGMYNKKFQAQLDLGGAVSIVTTRGGGEKGRDFQMLGKADRFKQMQDIVAAAKDLQKTYPGVPIIASGRSFGGLMTLMLAVHYPQYFAGFSSVVPVSDLNEFFNRQLFGRFAGDDFLIPRDASGQSRDTAEWRNFVNTFNPLWNLPKLKPENIKPLIIFSGGQDERVGPEQGRFFVKAFLNLFPQYADKIHYYEEPLNGHVGRTEFAQEATFIARTLGLSPEDYKPLKK